MAKVVPLASAKAFLDALEKSGLQTPESVAALRKTRGEDVDPKLIARDLAREGVLTRWQAGQLLHGFHQLIVGKYKLMDQIGSGEMGRVYLAEHVQLGRKASLKILSRKYTANPETLNKVLEDGRKASSLDHRNLTHVFDVNSEDDRYYLVTEYVEGKDLRQLVEASGATAPAQAVEIVRQAAEGLEHAHGQEVVHGDLKPSNVIVDASGIVKILDLGLARLAQTTPATGDESTEMATLAAQSFHAPEQASQHTVSPQSDVFSLGGILYYLLSGKAPLGNVKTPQDVKGACPAASDELAELCSRMLSEDPATRPQSAREVIESLDAAARTKSKPSKEPQETTKPNGEKSQGKQRKPQVAKSLEIPFPSPPAAAPPIPFPESQAEDTGLDGLNFGDAAPQPAVAAGGDDPFSGFSLQTKRKKQKPAEAEGASPPPPPEASEADVDAPIPSKPARKAVSLPVVLAVGIGGGVLILGLGMTLLLWVLSRGDGKQDRRAVAKAETKQSAAVPSTAEPNPEANPEVNPEVNPAVPPASAVPATAPTKTEQPPKVDISKAPPPQATPTGAPPVGPTEPMKPDVKPATPMPAAPATTVAANPVPKSEPAKTAPMPAPMPKGEPATAVGNPFVGFAKMVSLPPLEEKGKLVAEATKPVSLGTIKLPPKLLCLINLKGGDNAIGVNAKQKVVLEAGNNGTSERDWDFKLVTEGSTTKPVVAKLALQEDQLNFQWTDEAAKQLASAPCLCNCVLTMSAGTGSHQLALRQPITAEPMKIDLEKPMSVKYNIDYPPRPKQIVIQLGPPEGDFPKFKFEKPELTASKDSTFFMTGQGDEALTLHFSLTTTMAAKLLRIDAKPFYKIHGMTQAKPWLKPTMSQLDGGVTQASNAAIAKQTALAAATDLTAEQKADAERQIKKEVEDTGIQKAQVTQLKTQVQALQGMGKIHFRIYYEADSETKVDLVSTGAPPPMPAAAK